jgi:O-methyltransferase
MLIYTFRARSLNKNGYRSELSSGESAPQEWRIGGGFPPDFRRRRSSAATTTSSPALEPSLPFDHPPASRRANTHRIPNAYCRGARASLQRAAAASGANSMRADLFTARLRNRYLNLLENALVGSLYEDPSIAAMLPETTGSYVPGLRAIGGDWPRSAHTMIGRARMRNLRQACEIAILDDVPGDFLEAGVWRGGAAIFMRGILEAYGDADRRVIVADSFVGVPQPTPDKYPDDSGDLLYLESALSVSRKHVEDNFRRYGLLDPRVIFLEGWFKDTLPNAPIDRLSVLRIDGDLYESTIQVFESCYHKVSAGGVIIVDDYHAVKGCEKATNDFRSRHGITSPILQIDTIGVWWVVGS